MNLQNELSLINDWLINESMTPALEKMLENYKQSLVESIKNMTDDEYLESIDAEDWDGHEESDICMTYLLPDGRADDQDYFDSIEQAELSLSNSKLHAGQTTIIYSAPRTYTRLKVIRP